MRELKKTGKRRIAWSEMMPLDQVSVNTHILRVQSSRPATATTFEDFVEV